MASFGDRQADAVFVFGPPPQPPAPAPATALAAGAGDHHHVRAEGAPEVDLAPVQRDFETVRDKLLDRWADVRAAWRADLRRQIVKAIDDGTSLAALELDPDAGAARIREAVADMWTRATATVRKEAAAQGVDLTAAAPARVTAAARKKKTAESYNDIAADIAALMAQALALSAGQEATRVKTPDKTGAQVAGEVDAALAKQTDARGEATLSGVLTGAQNAARVEAMAAGPVGSLYADEQMDGNTCVNCSQVNGRFICTTEDLGPYDRMYTELGGYVDCLGGIRCRGTVTGVWRPATTTSNPEDV